MKVNLNTNNKIHSLEELALATGRVPHDAHVDVPTVKNDEVKRGVLLMLFGGVPKTTMEGTHLRGDINVCIVVLHCYDFITLLPCGVL